MPWLRMGMLVIALEACARSRRLIADVCSICLLCCARKVVVMFKLGLPSDWSREVQLGGDGGESRSG